MDNIFNIAFKSKTGEYAWKTEDVRIVVNILKQSSLAILGAEVWIIDKEEKINELYWFDFKIHDKEEEELWYSFVEETCNEFLSSFSVIKDNKRILEEKEADQGELYFNISFVDELGYNALFKEIE